MLENIVKKVFHNWRGIGKGFAAAALISAGAVYVEQNFAPIQKSAGYIAGNTSAGERIDKVIERECRVKDKRGKDVKVYDSSGDITSVKKVFSKVKYDNISPYAVISLEAIEDRRFNSHYALDIYSISRSIFENIAHFSKVIQRGRFIRGASTIPMQLIDILTPDSKGISGKVYDKVKEAVYASYIKSELSDEEIIECYLNNVDFGYAREMGQSIKGIGAAASYYFGKSSDLLSPTEAYLLINMIKAPTTYGTKVAKDFKSGKRDKGKHYLALIRRGKANLSNLDSLNREYGRPILSEEDYIQIAQDINYNRIRFSENNIDMVDGVDVSEYNALVYKELSDLEVSSDKLDIHTYLDLDLQRYSRASLRRGVYKVRRMFGDKGRYINGSAVIIDGNKGRVLSAVGRVDNKGYIDRVSKSYTSVGSTIKPFVTLIALNEGLDLDYKIRDIQYEYKDNGRLYGPKNFHQHTGRLISLRSALINSVNSVFVELGSRIMHIRGSDDLAALMQSWGLPIKSYKLSSSLGSDEISLIDMTAAYQVFLNHGTVNESFSSDYTFINFVESDGVVKRFTPYKSRVVDAKYAEAIDNVLADVVSIGTGRNAAIDGYNIRGKTGTSRDGAWFIGYEKSSKLMVGVMIASDEPRKTGPFNKSITGGKYAAPIFREIIGYALSKHDQLVN